MDADLSILASFLDRQGRLTALPAKNKKKLAALWYLAQKIELEWVYAESEINDFLSRIRREAWSNDRFRLCFSIFS